MKLNSNGDTDASSMQSASQFVYVYARNVGLDLQDGVHRARARPTAPTASNGDGAIDA